MKREFLTKLLPDALKEVIDQIMNENGKDIEAQKNTISTLTTERDGLKTQLDTAQAEIRSYKDMDIDGIKAKASEWEEKYKADTQKLRDDLAAAEYGHTVKDAVASLKFSSESAKKAFVADLTAKKLPVQEGKGDFRCQLYGNDFSLGDATVLMGPYTTKGNGAIYKAITYTEGDQRRIKFKRCNNSVCYLITDEKKADIAKLLEDIGQYIQVGNMDCIWDFIYEVHS